MSNNPFDSPISQGSTNPFEPAAPESKNPFDDFAKGPVTQKQETSDWDIPSPQSPQTTQSPKSPVSPRGSTQRYSMPEEQAPVEQTPTRPSQTPHKIADYSFKVVDYEVVNSSYAVSLLLLFLISLLLNVDSFF